MFPYYICVCLRDILTSPWLELDDPDCCLVSEATATPGQERHMQCFPSSILAWTEATCFPHPPHVTFPHPLQSILKHIFFSSFCFPIPTPTRWKWIMFLLFSYSLEMDNIIHHPLSVFIFTFMAHSNTWTSSTLMSQVLGSTCIFFFLDILTTYLNCQSMFIVCYTYP